MKYLNLLLIILFVFGVNANSSSYNINVDILAFSTLKYYNINKYTLLNSNQGVVDNSNIDSLFGLLEDVLSFDSTNTTLLLTFSPSIGLYYLYSNNGDENFKIISQVAINQSIFPFFYEDQRYIFCDSLKTAYLPISLGSYDVDVLSLNFGTGEMGTIRLPATDSAQSPQSKQAIDSENEILYISYITNQNQTKIASIDLQTQNTKNIYPISNIPQGNIKLMFTNQKGDLFVIKPTNNSNTTVTICKVDFGNSNNCTDIYTISLGYYFGYNYQPYVVNNDKSELMFIQIAEGTTTGTTTFNLIFLDINNSFTPKNKLKMKFLSLFVLVLLSFSCINSTPIDGDGSINIYSLSRFPNFVEQSILLNTLSGVKTNHSIHNLSGSFEDVLYYDRYNDTFILTRSDSTGYYYLYTNNYNENYQMISQVEMDKSLYPFSYLNQRFTFSSDSKSVFLPITTITSKVNVLEINFGTGQMLKVNLGVTDSAQNPQARQAIDDYRQILYVSYVTNQNTTTVISLDLTTYKTVTYPLLNIDQGLVNYMFTSQNGNLYVIKPTPGSKTNVTVCKVDLGITNNCKDIYTISLGNYLQYNYQPYIVNSDFDELMFIQVVEGTTPKTTSFQLTVIDIINNFTPKNIDFTIDNDWYLSSQITQNFFNF
ncbi:hypothetical protein DICPUDRAFT_79906 [Dictyostelium purpureum]|uniref:Cadherin domain-containing protein n=1 Tax=Dictyostelium purpureum TaxID=5786 RepID=F0ZNZ8_DICPU|nr:uncharacterized protein DICPUDRAFT_79906 [Dictyostelium purpureum]EGC34338.1 hypothetical protein DICPUDRAFT_79906 [Dictyostelium purpureum]|eukprot:XP_003289131.1 hypothetical protein DICPUDRAFT_79906 [Dictyostelium purpureum]